MNYIDSCISDIRNEMHEESLFRENEDAIFMAGNFIVLERYTGKNFSYRMINLSNMSSKYLFHRKSNLPKELYANQAKKILQVECKNTAIPNPESTYKERAEKLLSRIFIDILPKHGYKFRKNQYELSLLMLRGLFSKSISLMEAEVGIGKTHAYIIAAVVHGLFYKTKNTIISTSTIALQKSITKEYIPQISHVLLQHKILHNKLSFVVRKGKSHYVCDLRLKKYWSAIEDNNIPREDYKNLYQLLFTNYNQIDLDEYSLTSYIKDKICVNDKCNDVCSHYDNCRFIRFNNECTNSSFDFQIANHNYVMADILSKKGNRKKLLSDYSIVIFDEAHKIYDAAKQMYGCFFTNLDIKKLLAYVKMSKLRELKSDEIQIICDRMELCNNKVFLQLLSQAPKSLIDVESTQAKVDFTYNCQYYMKELINSLDSLSEYVYSCSDKRLKVRGRNIQKMCREISDKLTIFTSPDNLICWIESQKTSYKLCAIPKQLNKILAEDIWRKRIPYILTSGTISADNSFDLLKRKTGIEMMFQKQIIEVSKKSMFDYKNNTLMYIPESMPFPNMQEQEYTLAIINEIDKLIKSTYGHALILFTSYRLMDKVFSEVSHRKYDFPLFLMGKGRIDVLSNFKISGNGVLFASDTAGEGIDIVGDALSNLIIVKLPFAVPNPISEYEQSEIGGLQEYLDKINTPNMIIKLKQYAGRLIRSESDTGVIAILDSRVSKTGKYRDVVLESLFDTTVTDDIREVANFIRNKKDKLYFE